MNYSPKITTSNTEFESTLRVCPLPPKRRKISNVKAFFSKNKAQEKFEEETLHKTILLIWGDIEMEM